MSLLLLLQPSPGGGPVVLEAFGTAQGTAAVAATGGSLSTQGSAGTAAGRTTVVQGIGRARVAVAGTVINARATVRGFTVEAVPVPAPVPELVDVGPLGDFVEPEIDRVATQYRESTKLLGVMRTYLAQVAEAIQFIHAIPSYFDLNTAVGDQLTLLGKRMGFPRCHCVCEIMPVFGFDCGGFNYPPVVGFCVSGSTWIDCDEIGTGSLCINNDDVYRRYLKARRYQMLGLYDLASLQSALSLVWGEQARVMNTGPGFVTVAPNRLLTSEELAQLPIAFRVFPIAPGIRADVHFGTQPIFGFGTGWAGFCETPAAEWLCPTDPHTYDCAA